MSIKFTGLIITLISSLLYLYYFIWLLITVFLILKFFLLTNLLSKPLIDPEHHILNYFP